MIVPKGVDASPYTLTEPRELVLRLFATRARATTPAAVTIERPVDAVPLDSRAVTMATGWLVEHGYLAADAELTSRGWQVAAHLSRADRHDPLFDIAAMPDPHNPGKTVPATRVRCTCGHGGARNEQGPPHLIALGAISRGGRENAARLLVDHQRAAKPGGTGPVQRPKPRDPFAGAAPVDDDDF